MADRSAAQKNTRIVVIASTYFGASSFLNKKGPAMLAAANRMKRRVLVVARLVCPAMF